VFRALEKRFDKGAWALFSEVGNATGSRCERHADAVAMSLWPSRGLTIHGVEIKVSRSDWLNELRQPEKSDPIQAYTDHWWVAVANADIVQTGELPATWGLLVMGGEKLVAKVDAPKLEPKPLDRSFVAALLRRASEGLDARVMTARSEGVEEGRGKGPPEHEGTLNALRSEVAAHKEAIEKFEAASGVKIDAWNYDRIGGAVKKVLSLTRYHELDAIEEMTSVKDYLEHKARMVAKEIETLEAARKLALKAIREGEWAAE
jgi:hypothetical protein